MTPRNVIIFTIWMHYMTFQLHNLNVIFFISLFI